MIPLAILFWALAVIAVLVAVMTLALMVAVAHALFKQRGRMPKSPEPDRVPTIGSSTVNVYAAGDPEMLGARISSQIDRAMRS